MEPLLTCVKSANEMLQFVVSFVGPHYYCNSVTSEIINMWFKNNYRDSVIIETMVEIHTSYIEK